ncbi:uncharacterized protein LOC112054098 [Bicyclus anynana]|uniref:Uncharacterized protein LOC112054098 n=1 Tax=Bicyclus anynana TaxID=110368 RepID=A0A6J1NXQ7_BICAN|nr:uncharacterized protein LOC112054098 [Bicyclus anynana]
MLGFYGVKSQKYKFALGYTVLLVPILAFEIAFTVYAFLYIDGASSLIKNLMYILYPRNPGLSTTAWDNMHRELQCCGLQRNWDNNATALPISCCPIPSGAISPFECTSQNSHRSRCDIVISSGVTNDLYTFFCVGAVIASLQIIIIGLSAWMTHRLKHKPSNANRDSQKIVAPTRVVTDYSKY